jgi:phosphohistidine phosphatase SixA
MHATSKPTGTRESDHDRVLTRRGQQLRGESRSSIATAEELHARIVARADGAAIRSHRRPA